MLSKPLIDAVIKQIPEPQRTQLLALVAKLKAIATTEDRNLWVAAMQITSLAMIDDEEKVVCDTEAITLVEPVLKDV